MSQFHFLPEDYLDLMHSELPAYEELQNEVAKATEGMDPVERILELGTGTGETSRRVLDRHAEARLTGVDTSEEMLVVARSVLPPAKLDEILVRSMQDPLPPGPFDLVISALTVHHLDSASKADLFRRIARALTPRGRFVLGDVVVPADPADAVTPLSPDYDMPDRTEDVLSWLGQGGFDARVTWAFKDLAVIAADRVRARD